MNGTKRAADEPDSRTSSVGRKRAYRVVTDDEKGDVIEIEDSSSEDGKRSMKRAMHARAAELEKSPEFAPIPGERNATISAQGGVVHKGAEPKKVAETAENIESLRRYYPVDGGKSHVSCCLTCIRHEHTTPECPYLTCFKCGSRGSHFLGACPQAQRCMKCRELGHTRERCPEKLAVTASEKLLACDICQSTSHLEANCHHLWRSYNLEVVQYVQKVVNVLKECYSCGASGHYGPECGIHRGPLLTDGLTWSTENWSRYVDPASTRLSLAETKDYRVPPKKGMSIKGQAPKEAPPAEKDGESTAFLGKKVKKNARPVPQGKQHIKFGAQNAGGEPARGQQRGQPEPRGNQQAAFLPPNTQRTALEPDLRSRSLINGRYVYEDDPYNPPYPRGPPPQYAPPPWQNGQQQPARGSNQQQFERNSDFISLQEQSKPKKGKPGGGRGGGGGGGNGAPSKKARKGAQSQKRNGPAPKKKRGRPPN
jgi:hypothetical protein